MEIGDGNVRGKGRITLGNQIGWIFSRILPVSLEVLDHVIAVIEEAKALCCKLEEAVERLD